MHARDWIVCLIEPNKFEAQIILDLLRSAGVEKMKWLCDSEEALAALELYPANVIVASAEAAPMDGVAWTKAFRRTHQMFNRKAAVFLTSRAFSRTLAEECRHAGANALIGKPVSAKILNATIAKVLANPRPFIDASNYVGPCRRAGIVTAGAPKRRRQADVEAQDAPAGPTLDAAIASLARAVEEMIDGQGKADACEAALRHVQAYAVNAGDGPLMRTCAAITLQLGAKQVPPDAARIALQACMAGVKELARLDIADAPAREAVAERVRQAVAKAATRRAA
jgi:CheY-like chemotaxis protein